MKPIGRLFRPWTAHVRSHGSGLDTEGSAPLGPPPSSIPHDVGDPPGTLFTASIVRTLPDPPTTFARRGMPMPSLCSWLSKDLMS